MSGTNRSVPLAEVQNFSLSRRALMEPWWDLAVAVARADADGQAFVFTRVTLASARASAAQTQRSLTC